MEANRTRFPVRVMCCLYGVTASGFYAWCRRPESVRSRRDSELRMKIERVFRESRQTYGSPRVHAQLKATGERVGCKRIARVMREHQIVARHGRLYRSNPGHHEFFTSIPNRQLEILADRPDRVWVGDVTYLKVRGQWRYLAVVLDKYSRRILSWAMSKERNVALTLKALNRAVRHRRTAHKVIFHSDRGIEYAGFAYRQRLARLGFTQSMNRPRHMNDNAHMESFFQSMKSDTIPGERFDHEQTLLDAIRSYVPFYNHQRLHSSLGYTAPAHFEAAPC